ncbi:protein arginine N-methyltransferase 1.5-like isoform X2 [Trifolium pratense]|uniref:protein arginine N-methyltransferase 1.5-like isoform X2 n=2 Tax=Trifolium pratense TaxID=57577 RepID=UPI001E692553|nr:protein arginine N-methyltransferase 1.5-like isoform X2 [Trifolium pratense]XP_045821611.1 protein arginine N-methyltransferase 1.5-like isoform X2 [Trifolium pratense]
MPLVDNEKDTSRSKLCGLETYFNKSMTHILGANVFIDGGFDFVVVPLMSPTYRPSLVQQFGSFSIEASLPCARSDLDPMPYLWQDHVIGKISEWIDLDSPDEMVRKDSETAFKQELAWASYLSLQACILPTPKGNSWTNYARCANQFLQEQPKEMQLWLRIPLVKPDGDSVEIYRTPDDYWKIWNSFRLMCDHNSKLLVALDNWSTMPSENSLNSWYGEPVVTFIIHTNSFFTRDGDNPKHLSEGLQKLIAYFLNHFTQIIISEVQLFSESISEVQHNYRNVDAISDEASRRRHLLPHIHYLRSLYQQVGPLSSPLSLQEHLQLAVRDVIQYTSQPFKEILESVFYQRQESDKKIYMMYKSAICQALLDRVPDEKASVITIVLVVVDAGHGALVKTSLQAAKETGRKLKVYAVEKNLNPLPYLYKKCNEKDWKDIVTLVQTDVRYWNAPEKADILVSELLGSFGDNKLAPECLDGAQRFLKEDGISIPSSYTSFLQPVKNANLYNSVKGGGDNILRLETTFNTRMYNVARLAPCQPLFTFTHPKRSVKESNRRYKKLQFVIPDDPESAIVHGFAGYFDATLYKDVHLGTEPSKATPDVFSWEQLFFPLREPICVQRGSTLEAHFWRCCGSTKVWYEWSVTSPSTSLVHNCNARADCVWLN